MKNFLKIGLCLTLAFIIASCENPTNEKPTLIDTTLEAITIKTNPTKTTYQINEEFDPTGLVITATYIETYSNASTKTTTKDVTYNNGNMTFSGTDFSTAGTKTITVTYSEKGTTKTATLQVTVNQDGTPESGEDNSKIDTTLEAITIKTNPTKTTYQINEEFDPTGLVITATYTETYSNASTKTTTKDVTYNNGNMTFSGTDFSTAGTKTITVTYSEKGTTKTATLQVTVNQDEGIVDPNIFTYDDEVTIAANTYTAGTDVTIQIPATENEQPTTVNIAKLYEQYNTIAEQVGEEGSVSISYADPANTTIENETDTSFYMNNYLDTEAIGDVDQYKNIKSFINAINSSIDTTKDFPKISAKFSGRVLNLYHTGLADLFNLYCNNNKGDKLEGVSVSISNGSFDAVDYLTEKGGIAYDQNNQYTGNYYDLDVNAALLMGVPLKNVNVVGDALGDVQIGNSITNVRFDFNLPENATFTCEGASNTYISGTGLIEFAGDTPSVLPVTDKAKLVISNADNENTVILKGGAVIDLTQLPDDGNVSFYNSGNVYYEHAYFKNEEAKQNYIQNGFGNNGTTYSLENGTSSIPYYATSQQWVDAANANDGEGNFVKTDGGVYMPNVSNLQ